MTVALLLCLAATPSGVVLKAPGGFVVFNGDGKVAQRISRPGGRIAEALAFSPDGKWQAFTSFDAEAQQPLLYKVRTEQGSVAELAGRPFGFHDSPTFSHDGRYIFFVHHPKRDGGPPMVHGMRAWAQLWRVPTAGGAPEQLTTSEGCKMHPEALGPSGVLYTHSTCAGDASVEAVSDGRIRSFAQPLGVKHFRLPRIAPDGKSYAAVGDSSDSIVVFACSFNGECREVARLPNGRSPRQVGWLSSARLLVQMDLHVVEVNLVSQSTRLLAQLDEVLP